MKFTVNHSPPETVDLSRAPSAFLALKEKGPGVGEVAQRVSLWARITRFFRRWR